ncbi:MAG: FHA domain-containing protein, partial [Anaerolineae bacterium]|nr:FHA domain-containing protein [Anaerolineae bacterium]
MDKNDPLLVDNIPPGVYLVFNAQLFPISKAVTKIGRKLDNDLVLQDTTISRYHAEIHFEENQFVIKDLNSSGGTFLNNRKVSEGVLFS